VSEKRKAATAACSFKLSTKLHLRVESADFASPEEARKELGNLENRLNMHGMWVSKRFPQLADAGVSANRIDVPAPVIPANDSPIHQDEKPAEVLIII